MRARSLSERKVVNCMEKREIESTKNELLEIIRKSDLSYDEAFRVLQSVKVELQNKMIKNKLV